MFLCRIRLDTLKKWIFLFMKLENFYHTIYDAFILIEILAFLIIYESRLSLNINHIYQIYDFSLFYSFFILQKIE